MNKRIFIEKKAEFDVHSAELEKELKHLVEFKSVKQYIIYDVFNATEALLEKAKFTVFSDPVTDVVFNEAPKGNKEDSLSFAIEYVPGQYDQRADSAEQCMQLLDTSSDGIKIRSGKFLIFEGLSPVDLPKVKNYIINVVETKEKDLLQLEYPSTHQAADVPIIAGFIDWDATQMLRFFKEFGFALALDDLFHIQKHFKKENRNPSETELKVLDTYWSDHCRHTTFETVLTDIQFEGAFKTTLDRIFKRYLEIREELGRQEHPITLMDLAVVAARYFNATGKLDDLVISEEVNACTITLDVKTANGLEPWYLLFKNETHNHPTEIEPFGGASTCIGGAIRDPLSGRAYVYQAMRVTGSANPNEAIEDTLEGKLPQRKITIGAAQGYSSYGNQIGLATSHVAEIYDEGYKAKRMEVGMVVAAVPQDWVRRESPVEGDVVLLLGGATGRDGVGGASGSSKSHDTQSTVELSSEVQKGNAPEERKIQRFFRNKEVAQLIKKCNDFGAGGVSVAIGELADSLVIDLDQVPVKYEGLNGTELAISESQERMAVVIEAKDIALFQALARKENLEAIKVAEITNDNRLVMNWRGKTIVDLDRSFLDTNGVQKEMAVRVETQIGESPFVSAEFFSEEKLFVALADLNIASQKGLIEMFDASVGRTTVLMPLGGKHQLTPSEGSVHTIPTTSPAETVSLASWGFSPKISKWNTLHGGAYAVVESIAKIVAMGGDYSRIRFSFQEYFQKLGADPKKWGLPFGALMGALDAQLAFELAAIGGKDSMSGTFNEIHVPPTLISFAVGIGEKKDIVSSELKTKDNKLYVFRHQMAEDQMPNYEQLKEAYNQIHQEILLGNIVSAKSLKEGGLAVALTQMAAGNSLGIEVSSDDLLGFDIGSLVLEVKGEITAVGFDCIGKVTDTAILNFNAANITLASAVKKWTQTWEEVFPSKTNTEKQSLLEVEVNKPSVPALLKGIKPQVLIPVFPGTNCEYESQQVFEQEGAKVNSFVFSNHKAQWIEESITEFESQLKNSQILMLPGGFSAGDEPDGSAKFIVSILKNQRIQKEIHKLLDRDGLILGICNGFQALVKSGLVSYGEIKDLEEESPTLTFNEINRHVSQMVNVKVVNDHSPWLKGMKGETYTIPVSHGEGRFYTGEKSLQKLISNGQVATQYVDTEGNPSVSMPFNPNGSVNAIEGITSPCGKIYGRMAHPERFSPGLMKNIPNAGFHNIFKNGVDYFK